MTALAAPTFVSRLFAAFDIDEPLARGWAFAEIAQDADRVAAELERVKAELAAAREQIAVLSGKVTSDGDTYFKALGWTLVARVRTEDAGNGPQAGPARVAWKCWVEDRHGRRLGRLDEAIEAVRAEVEEGENDAD